MPLDHVRFFNNGSGLEAIMAIEAFPEIAVRIGVLMACFATAELTLRDLLSRILNISQEEAGDVLGHLNSVSLRTKIVETLASTKPDSELKKQVRALLSEIRWLASERNKYAHAQYVAPQGNNDQRLFRVAFFTDKKTKTLYDEMTISRVDTDIERAKHLICSLWQLLRA